MNRRVAKSINQLVTEIPGYEGDIYSNQAKRLKKKIWNKMSAKEKEKAWANLK